MSKFWAAAGSDDSSSSSDSSDDSSSSSDSSVGGGRADANRWVMDSDSESEESVRVAKSAKTRAFESFEAHVSKLRNAMKTNDHKSLMDEFELLTKAMIKSTKVFDANGGIPRFLVRMLCDLEDHVGKSLADKASFKKLKPAQGRALNRMKLNLKKFCEKYRGIMEEYRKNPVISSESSSSSSSSSSSESEEENDSDDSSSSDSSSSSGSSSSSASSGDKKEAAADSDDSDSDSDSDSGSDSDDSVDWAQSSDSDSSDSESEAGGAGELKGRARWLKRTTVVKEKVEKDKAGRAEERKRAKEEAAKLKAEQEAQKAEEGELKEEDLTPSLIQKKTLEIVSSRGRKGTDAKALLGQLEALSKLATRFGPRVEIPVLMHVITAQFDMQRTIDDYMDTPTWRSCAGYLERAGSILGDEKEGWKIGAMTAEDDELASDMMMATMGKAGKMKSGIMSGAGGAMAAMSTEEKLINPHTGEVETEDERMERLRLEREANMTEDELKTIRVPGSLSLFLSRLDEEYNKSLQRISPHSIDYVVRLQDETKLRELLGIYQKYYERVDSASDAAMLAELRVEHMYYRHDSIVKAVAEAQDTSAADGNTSEEMTNLCTYIYQHGTDRQKTRAMLCHIYHHALHDRFLEARDLLLMSHLQETIPVAGDIATMILFNRTMVTLGLAAFRLGNIWDSHQCLSDICSGRVRELLAQGVSTGRFSDKSPEQEKAEKRRQIPYHQHINLDLLEACHLISAMFLEVPNMASAGDNDRRGRVLSRTFRKYHDMYDRQVFTGPPEQTRDFVMTATKALLKGDWKKCSDLLKSLECWDLVPGDNGAEEIKKMLGEKIKQTGLRTYLLAFSAQYDSLSLSQLCEMFDMTKNEVHAIVSKMMINHDLIASWDQPTETIVMRNIEPSALQLLALQFAEKATSLVDANERLLDAKTGNYGYKDGDNWRGGNNQGNRFGFRSFDKQGARSGRGGAGGRGNKGRGGGGRGGGGRGGGRGGGGRGRRFAPSRNNNNSKGNRW